MFWKRPPDPCCGTDSALLALERRRSEELQRTAQDLARDIHSLKTECNYLRTVHQDDLTKQDNLNKEVQSLNAKLKQTEDQARDLRTAKAVWDCLSTLESTVHAYASQVDTIKELLTSIRRAAGDAKKRIGDAYELSTRK